MLNLFRKDLIINKNKIKTHLTVLVFIIPFLIALFGVGEFPIFLLLALGYIVIFPTINFEDDDTNTHIAIAYLPVYNREIVFQKYLLLFINYIFGIIYLFILLYILNLFGLEHIKLVNINLLLRISFLIFLISSIILPLYFWLSNRWFNTWATFTIAITINTSRSILERDSVFNDTNSSILLIIILIMYILSLILSLNIYKTRDIE